MLFTDAGDLDGLGDDQLAVCARVAAERGIEGWLVTLPLYTDHPYQARLTNRDTRRRLHEASIVRGARGNEFDTREIVRSIATLRAERAGLLGFRNHAELVLATETIGGPDDLAALVHPLVAPTMANVRREAAALQEIADRTLAAQGIDSYEIAPWDWAFWTERLRAELYDIDTEQLREYFELDRVLVDGVFWAATELYGVTFTPRPDIVTYHPDARTVEVFDADGTSVGLFIHDPFTRDSKRGGAWMNNLVEQNRLFDQRPVVLNTLNLSRPADGEPALLTLDEVTTLFHEFGHALHGLFSNASYEALAGTRVPRDFVEFPSQVNEMWILWPEVVQNYARHHVTGEPIDPQLLERLADSSLFNQGFMTAEYLGAALLDQEWHSLAPGEDVEDVLAFEQAAMERVEMANPWVLPRYRTTYFNHVFGGGYSAGYYSYIHSEILDADTVEWFRANGGLRRENGDHFRREVLSRGDTREPMDSFRAFRGRDADITPLLVRRGLA